MTRRPRAQRPFRYRTEAEITEAEVFDACWLLLAPTATPEGRDAATLRARVLDLDAPGYVPEVVRRISRRGHLPIWFVRDFLTLAGADEALALLLIERFRASNWIRVPDDNGQMRTMIERLRARRDQQIGMLKLAQWAQEARR